MKVKEWNLICGLRSEISKLLDKALVANGAGNAGGGRTVFRSHTRMAKEDGGRGAASTLLTDRSSAATALRNRKGELSPGIPEQRSLDPTVPTGSSVALLPVEPALLDRLRDELLGHLEVLDERLSKELPESEVQLVLFPLVLLCDEMVMVRLPKEQHTKWQLLQSDLFQINYGGDVFYDFADEHLAKASTPSIVFEVLYYCLHAGFVGRFGFDAGKVKRYRTLLSERVLQLVEPADVANERSTAKEPTGTPPRLPQRLKRTSPVRRVGSALLYYGAGLLLVSIVLLLVASLTNV